MMPETWKSPYVRELSKALLGQKRKGDVLADPKSDIEKPEVAIGMKILALKLILITSATDHSYC